MPKKEIYFEGSYDPNHQCIKIFGDGAAEIKFNTDATQLASVLFSLAAFKGRRIGVTLKKLADKQKYGKEKISRPARVYR